MTYRILKFRAWDKVRKTMAYPKGQLWKSDFWELIEADPDSWEVMQFTGLKDKSGREIYEGDVLTCFDTDVEEVYTHKVELPDFYREVWSNNEHGLPAEEGEKTKVEVVGNVWENPELLK